MWSASDALVHQAEGRATHSEIWEYCQSTRKVQAYVLQNVRVPHGP